MKPTSPTNSHQEAYRDTPLALCVLRACAFTAAVIFSAALAFAQPADTTAKPDAKDEKTEPAAKPETTKPEAPKADKPEATSPEETKPEKAKPDETKPVKKDDAGEAKAAKADDSAPFTSQLIAKSADSGLYAGATLGLHLPMADIIGSGYGLELEGEWRQSVFLGFALGLQGGQFPINGAEYDNGGNLIQVQSGGGMNYLYYKLGARFYFMFKKVQDMMFGIAPCAGLFLTYHSLGNSNFGYAAAMGFALELGLWRRVINRVEAGVLVAYNIWSSDTVNVAGKSYTIATESFSELRVQVGARYHVF